MREGVELYDQKLAWCHFGTVVAQTTAIICEGYGCANSQALA
jgi:hypothetical protein